MLDYKKIKEDFRNFLATVDPESVRKWVLRDRMERNGLKDVVSYGDLLSCSNTQNDVILTDVEFKTVNNNFTCNSSASILPDAA